MQIMIRILPKCGQSYIEQFYVLFYEKKIGIALIN